MTLSTLLSERVKNNPKKICIKFEDRKISYAEADTLVSRGAGGLQSLGLTIQGRVALLMDNCPEYIISYFSIIRAGGIAVPINTFLTPDEIVYILNDSGCTVLIYSEAFSSHVEEIKKKIPDLRTYTFDDVPVQEAQPVQASENDIAVLLYTSGTTGFPKGAMLTHRNLLSNAEAIMKVVQLTHKDRILLFLPLFHAFSFTVCVILPMYAGAQTVLLASVKPFSKVINSIFRDRITFFVAVPTIYTILCRKKMPFFVRLFLKFLINIRACISGAAALPESTITAFEKRFRIPLIEGYGLTEASPVVAVNPLRGLRKPLSVGPPLPGVEISVIGEEGEKMPPEGIGELIVKGPNVMKGYFNRNKETEAVLKDGWLWTGDMAKIDKDGYLYIVDRKKDLIIVDGMNIYPREVEEFLLKSASVEECAMVGIPDERGSELSVLFIKQKEETPLDEKDIRALFQGHIAKFKIPKRIFFIDEFPKTATGKIQKSELRNWDISGRRKAP